jgi:cell division protein FtsW
MARKSALLLLGPVMLLLVLGFIMQVSIGPYTKEGQLDAYAGVKSQALYASLGLVMMFLATKIDYQRYAQWNWVLYAVALVLLCLCFIPGIGMKINGASRWLRLPGGQVQPSEIAKLIGVMVIAAWCARHPETRRHFSQGFAVPMLIVGMLVVAIGCEVDLGNATLLTLASLSVLFAAGARLRYLGMILIGAVGALGTALMLVPERLGRIRALFDLEGHRAGDGLQQWVSLMAYSSGGASGLGLGNSREKMWSLPYANSDMVSAIIAEELGGWVTLMVVIAYVTVTVAGFLISVNAPDRFGKLLGFGLISLLALQTVIHLGVTTAMLPNKGMPMPFVSAGGSNLVCLLFSVGILLNIYQQGIRLQSHEALLGRAKLTPAL